MFCEYALQTVDIRQAKSREPANCRWAPQATQHKLSERTSRTRRKWPLSTLAERKSLSGQVLAGGDLIGRWPETDTQPWMIVSEICTLVNIQGSVSLRDSLRTQKLQYQ